MINNYTVPKRGTIFYWGEQKIDVWLERVISPEEFCVCDNQQRRVTDNYFNVNPKELIEQKKSVHGIKKVVKPVSPEEKKFRNDLNIYFAKQTLTMPSKCENCTAKLSLSTIFARRCQTAHILEKSRFKSVACHPQNKLFLGVYNCSCHQKFDNSTAEERSKMPCHKLALERFEEFKSELSGPDQIKAFTYLNIQYGSV